LNWALEGLNRLKDNKWRFNLTSNQNDLVEKVLLQSDSVRQFVKRCLAVEKDCLLTQEECFESYLVFCKNIGWYPVPCTKANPIIEDAIMRQYGINCRHDIRGSNGKDQRGWKGIKVKAT
jgi:phage/plasmid-associated DNA primase